MQARPWRAAVFGAAVRIANRNLDNPAHNMAVESSSDFPGIPCPSMNRHQPHLSTSSSLGMSRMTPTVNRIGLTVLHDPPDNAHDLEYVPFNSFPE